MCPQSDRKESKIDIRRWKGSDESGMEEVALSYLREHEKEIKADLPSGSSLFISGTKVTMNLDLNETVQIYLSFMERDKQNPRKVLRELIYSLGFCMVLNDLCEVEILHVKDKDGEQMDPKKEREFLDNGLSFILAIQGAVNGVA